MKIKLFGALPRVLRDLGLQPGQVWNAEPSQAGKYGAVILRLIIDDQEYIATVYKENYLVID